MIKIPFSFKYRSQIESGEMSVVIGGDISVRITCWDRPGKYPILGYTENKANTIIMADEFGKTKNDKTLFILVDLKLTEYEKELSIIFEEFLDSPDDAEWNSHRYSGQIYSLVTNKLVDKSCEILVDCIEDFMSRRMEIWDSESKQQTLDNIKEKLKNL